jgi:hypothetical protein
MKADNGASWEGMLSDGRSLADVLRYAAAHASMFGPTEIDDTAPVSGVAETVPCKKEVDHVR